MAGFRKALRVLVSPYKNESFQVNLNLPYVGGVSGTWVPDESQREAAWELYVELATRIAVVELKPDEGLLREALTSLYSLFATTRNILREKGPDVAKPGTGDMSFGQLAVSVLNGTVRPFLVKWHPVLGDYEEIRPPEVSQIDHERSWHRAGELRTELSELQAALASYAAQLAEVAEVPPLTAEEGRLGEARRAGGE